jgi:DNA-binding Lrp family transcriptional regulator
MSLLSLPTLWSSWQYPCRTRVKSMSKTLDRVDRRILDTLQADARISNQELAKRVGLSPAPCWRRLRRLEEEGFIAGYATLLNGSAIGLPILAYALVTLDNHHADTVRQFDRLIQDRPEVLECHSMSGPNDYLLRIVAASMEAYEHFLSSQVLQLAAVRSVNTSFVLRTKKSTTRLPVL